MTDPRDPEGGGLSEQKPPIGSIDVVWRRKGWVQRSDLPPDDPDYDGEAVEPRWEEWARRIAPLVHDGLIDTRQAGQEIPDKAFYLARLLDEHL